MDKANIFIPFTKKDNDEQMVFGYASTEAVDSQGEIVEKKAIMDALPDYMKFGNIREMHQPSAVGKAKQATIDEDGLFIKVKVVDDNAWEKVKEGVYNGFSIGGNVVQKVGNRIKELTLSEISLVDRPANPKSLFTVVKMDDKKVEKNDMEVIGPDSEQEERMTQVFEFLDRQVSIMEVSQVLELARQLVYMITDRIYAGKSYDDLENALDNLKTASKEILGEEAIARLDEIIDLAKATGDNPDNFAYISNGGHKALPIATAELVKMSFKDFYLVSFDSEDHKIVAAKVLKSAEKHFELDLKDKKLTEISDREVSADISKEYNNAYNNESYFNNMRMAIG